MMGLIKTTARWPRLFSLVFLVGAHHAWERWMAGQQQGHLLYMIGMVLTGLAVALGFLSLPASPPEDKGRKTWLLVCSAGFLGILCILAGAALLLLD